MSELLIKNGMVYTYIYEGYHAIKLRMADVFIKDKLIEEIGPDLRRGCDTLDAAGCLVLPGMVNMGSGTFVSRIMSGLICDWQRGKERIAPMLDMAAEMFTREEIEAVALTGLWETADSGALSVVELGRSKDGRDKEHPLFYRAAPKPIIEGVLAAGEKLGIEVYAGLGNETGGLTVDAPKKASVSGDVVTDSALTCADFGLPYAGLKPIKEGAMMTMGTGVTSSCMIKEMAATARAVKTGAGNPAAYRASDVFYSATVVGGRELDENRHGRLGPGFYGNISIANMDRFRPLSYPLSQYIYGAAAQDVRHLVCEGSVIKLDGQPTDPLQGILSDAAGVAEKAINKLWAEARKTIL